MPRKDSLLVLRQQILRCTHHPVSAAATAVTAAATAVVFGQPFDRIDHELAMMHPVCLLLLVLSEGLFFSLV
jgi:hypothetical protein